MIKQKKSTQCRECGAELDHLQFVATREVDGDFWPGGDTNDNNEETRDITFYCPECSEELFSSYREADDFLSNYKKPEPPKPKEPTTEELNKRAIEGRPNASSLSDDGILSIFTN